MTAADEKKRLISTYTVCGDTLRTFYTVKSHVMQRKQQVTRQKYVYENIEEQKCILAVFNNANAEKSIAQTLASTVGLQFIGIQKSRIPDNLLPPTMAFRYIGVPLYIFLCVFFLRKAFGKDTHSRQGGREAY